MFGLFKKRQSTPTAEELSILAASALDDVKNKWVYFNQTLQLKAEVPLSAKIDFFAQPIQHFFQAKYPLLLNGSSEIFWLTVLTAILESGTHPKDEVNWAIAELKSKYTSP